MACALSMLACQRKAAEKAPSPRDPKPAVVRPAPGPAALREALGIPGDAGNDPRPENPTATASARKLKTDGQVGDWLEGDLFWFKAAGVRSCGDGDAGRGRVVGVEVEIRAKSRLTFSPRELRLTSGGVVFHGNLDLDRQAGGCKPLLGIAWLKKDEVTKGFVLFDVPAPAPERLELHYQPTRWGGAGQVRVTLSPLMTGGPH